VAAGLLIAMAPPPLAALLIGGAALLILTLIDVRIGLLITLAIAPLKALVETEAQTLFPLPLNAGHLLLLATLAIWLARNIARSRGLDLRWTPAYLPVMAFTFVAALSLPDAASFSAGLTELLKWAEILAVMALVLSLGREGGPGWVAAALIAAAIPQALIGLYQFFGGSGAPHLWIVDYRYFRAFGTFGQPNPFGAYMGLTLPLALGAAYGLAGSAWAGYRAFRRSLDRAMRAQAMAAAVGAWLAFAAAIILGAGLLVSWSRGAWLGFVGALVALALFAPRRRWQGAALVILGAGGLWLGIVTGLAPASLVARVTDFAQDLTGIEDVRGRAISDENYAVIERLAHWQAALAMANESPWLGVGFGNYEIAYPRHALVNWPLALGHAHNYYLNLLAETGIIGLSAYVAAWIALAVLTLRALQRRRGLARGIALGLLGAWAYLAVHSVFDKLYVNNLFLHIGAMLGLIGVLLLPDGNADTSATLPDGDHV
jgi:putative inorganic carbon (HCO3(-)) transporter